MDIIRIDDNIILREIGVSDAPAVFAAIDSQREYLGRWLPFVPATKTVDDSLAFIESVVFAPDGNREKVLAIEVDGVFAGLMGLKNIDNLNLKAEIGYWLGQQYQGRGIATSCVKALCRVAFDELGINRIQICCAVGNTKSSAIPRRLGFRFEGVIRDGERRSDGSFHDIELYSLLKRDQCKK